MLKEVAPTSLATFCSTNQEKILLPSCNYHTIDHIMPASVTYPFFFLTSFRSQVCCVSCMRGCIFIIISKDNGIKGSEVRRGVEELARRGVEESEGKGLRVGQEEVWMRKGVKESVWREG